MVGLMLACTALLAVWIASPLIASTRGVTCEPGDPSGCDAVGQVLIAVFYVAPLLLIVPLVLLIRVVSKTSSRARDLSRNGDDAPGAGRPS